MLKKHYKIEKNLKKSFKKPAGESVLSLILKNIKKEVPDFLNAQYQKDVSITKMEYPVDEEFVSVFEAIDSGFKSINKKETVPKETIESLKKQSTYYVPKLVNGKAGTFIRKKSDDSFNGKYISILGCKDNKEVDFSLGASKISIAKLFLILKKEAKKKNPSVLNKRFEGVFSFDIQVSYKEKHIGNKQQSSNDKKEKNDTVKLSGKVTYNLFDDIVTVFLDDKDKNIVVNYTIKDFYYSHLKEKDATNKKYKEYKDIVKDFFNVLDEVADIVSSVENHGIHRAFGQENEDDIKPNDNLKTITLIPNIKNEENEFIGIIPIPSLVSIFYMNEPVKKRNEEYFNRLDKLKKELDELKRKIKKSKENKKKNIDVKRIKEDLKRKLEEKETLDGEIRRFKRRVRGGVISYSNNPQNFSYYSSLVIGGGLHVFLKDIDYEWYKNYSDKNLLKRLIYRPAKETRNFLAGDNYILGEKTRIRKAVENVIVPIAESPEGISKVADKSPLNKEAKIKSKKQKNVKNMMCGFIDYVYETARKRLEKILNTKELKKYPQEKAKKAAKEFLNEITLFLKGLNSLDRDTDKKVIVSEYDIDETHKKTEKYVINLIEGIYNGK